MIGKTFWSPWVAECVCCQDQSVRKDQEHVEMMISSVCLLVFLPASCLNDRPSLLCLPLWDTCVTLWKGLKAWEGYLNILLSIQGFTVMKLECEYLPHWCSTTSPPPGDPPQAAAWLGQCGIYLLIMVLEKGVISLVLLVPGWSKVRRCLCGEGVREKKQEGIKITLILGYLRGRLFVCLLDVWLKF